MKELFWWFVIISVLISGFALATLYVQESEATEQTLQVPDQIIEGVKYKVTLSDGIGTRDNIP